MANNSKLLKKKAATLGRHKKKIRSKVIGSAERPRLSVFRSNQHLYLQIIDDVAGTTLVHASTIDQDLKGKAGKNVAGAKDVGALIAKRAIAKNIREIVFDRNGLRYHGRVKAVAEGAREGGLNF